MNKYYATWRDIHAGCNNIQNAIHRSGKKYDCIVAVLRGGAVPATILSHAINCSMQAIGIKTYEDHVQTNQVYMYAQDTEFLNNCADKSILLVDDICDSGNTFKYLKQMFLDKGCNTVDAAAIYMNEACTYDPQYCGMVSSQWIVFPWEK